MVKACVVLGSRASETALYYDRITIIPSKTRHQMTHYTLLLSTIHLVLLVRMRNFCPAAAPHRTALTTEGRDAHARVMKLHKGEPLLCKGERPLWVRSRDLRRTAQQRVRCGESGCSGPSACR